MHNNYDIVRRGMYIVLTFYFSSRSINVSGHIISGCDNGRVYFHKFKRAERVAGNAFGHILITHENILTTSSFKYLHMIDDVRISISYVKCRQRVPKGS